MKFTFHSQSEVTETNFQSKLEQFKNLVNNPELGFFNLTENEAIIDQVTEVAHKIAHKKNFIQVGIGGSALGPEMLVHALKKNNKRFYCLDNTDSSYLHRCLQSITLQESIFYVVSKSGGTAETIACYSMIRNCLKEAGLNDFENYFVFCTDPENGQLREHVNKHSYLNLSLPANIGGRFSVLSPVGLLPAAFMGIEIRSLFEGANSIKTQLTSEDFHSNPLFKAGEMIFQAYQMGKNETVMMPYSSLLKSFSAWFVQLWAESLGKKKNGNSVGLTPIPAYGATDQHSQVQLFMEGPNNKLLFMLNIKSREKDFPLDSGLDLASGQKLAPFSMNQLLEAEFKGSIQALTENQRDIIEIELNCLDENSMGAMIMYFESLTALMGEYLEINAFDQPGVELGKKYAYQFLDSMQN